MNETVATRLAMFAIATRPEGIPDGIRARARLHFLDTLGCGIAAVATGSGSAASQLASAQGGRPESSLLGDPALVPAAVAALANGTRCHALDFDDTHERGICHASTVVAPVALAAGEANGASTEEVIDAYLLGNEVALRVAVASAEGLYERGFHPTGVCGAFGAAAAAARLYGLDLGATTNALGIVGSFASGLFEYLSDGSSTKPLHAGWAAHAGIQAALLAAAGGTGPARVLEGRFGLLRSHTGADTTAAEICAGLGERWEVPGLAIKAYPACHFAHSSTWAAGELADEHGVRAEDIEAIVVRIPEEGGPLVLEPPEEKLRPRTPYDAKFSLPFMVAHRLVRGVLDLTAFSPANIAEPTVLDLAARVSAEPIDQPVPSRFAGGARLITRSGERFDRLVEAAPGSPGNPLSDERIVRKFRENALLGLPSDTADEIAALATPGRSVSLGELGRALRAARAASADLA